MPTWFPTYAEPKRHDTPVPRPPIEDPPLHPDPDPSDPDTVPVEPEPDPVPEAPNMRRAGANGAQANGAT